MHTSFTRRLSVSIVALLLATLLAACGTPPGMDAAVPVLDAQPALELGTGEASFVAVPSGSTLELVQGPQGGWHVVLAARLSGFDPEGTILTFGVYEGTTLLAETPVAITVRRLVRDGAAYLKLGDLLIFSIGGPAEIVGRTVEIRASIRSGTTVLAMDSRMVTIVDAM